MRILLSILAVSILLSACNSNQSTSENQALGEIAEMSFDETTFDFGNVKPKEEVKFNYTFENTSENALVITKATASCGCTVPSYPKEPVAPGETGEIEVVYNAASSPGEVTKTITIVANTYPAKTILTLKGTIVP